MVVSNKFRIYLEAVTDLDGNLTLRRNTDVPTYVACFCIHHSTSPNGIQSSLEYWGVEPKTEAVPPPQAPSVCPSTSALTGFRPICVPDQDPFDMLSESILSFTCRGT